MKTKIERTKTGKSRVTNATKSTRPNRLWSNFAKVSVASLVIFALAFGVWLNFAGKNSENAHAETENEISQNTETETQNYTVKKLDFIHFLGHGAAQNPYIKLGVDQTGDANVKSTFRYYDSVGGWLFGSRVALGDNMLAFMQDGNGENRTWRADRGNTYRYLFGHFDNNFHEIEFRGADFYFDDELTFTYTEPAPDTPFEMYLGTINAGGSAAITANVDIYSFSVDKDGTENDLNLIPAARYSGCGESFTVEYGFANDLDNDGNLTNDEWFGNSGTGTLTGSEEIVAEECPVAPPENSDENSENPANEITPPIIKSEIVLAPNTGKSSKFSTLSF